jgi:hypothetical protein
VIVQDELRGNGNLRRRPTGLSSDSLTLFWWDEIDQKEKAGWRGTNTSFDLKFGSIVDLGDKKDAQPSSTCTKLYYSNPVMAPQDVKFANRN